MSFSISKIKTVLSTPKGLIMINTLFWISVFIVFNYYVYTNYNVPTEYIIDPIIFNGGLALTTYIFIVALHKFATWGSIDEEYLWDPNDQNQN